MYKLVAIDMDGTLLNSYGEASKENIDAIKKAINNNVEVVLTSGRIPSAMMGTIKETGANNYLISGNGSVIYDIKKEKIIFSNYMSKKKVLEIIKMCEENSIFYNIYTNDSIITKYLDYNVLFYHNENITNPEDKKIKINIIENTTKYIKEYEKEDFLKITICDNDEIIFKSIVNKLKEINKVDILEVSHMSRKIIKHGTEDFEIAYYYTEITNENVNKWSAIKYLSQKLNIKPDEILTIGDNFNDLEMIKNAGLGIAMGNSSPAIKKIADEITEGNDSNGVASAINKHVQD